MIVDDDRLLVRETLAGNRAAFESIVEKYHRVVYNVAIRIGNRAADAEDVTQTVFLKAYERLKSEGISIRIIDAYSVKPIDAGTLRQAAAETGGRLVVVEDHWFEGGLGDSVLDAFTGGHGELPRVVKLAVRGMPGSGTPAELLHAAGIDADHIATAVKGLLSAG